MEALQQIIEYLQICAFICSLICALILVLGFITFFFGDDIRQKLSDMTSILSETKKMTSETNMHNEYIHKSAENMERKLVNMAENKVGEKPPLEPIKSCEHNIPVPAANDEYIFRILLQSNVAEEKSKYRHDEIIEKQDDILKVVKENTKAIDKLKTELASKGFLNL